MAIKGRGATHNPDNRFSDFSRESFDDGWDTTVEIEPLRTTLTVDHSRKALAWNDSPDIPFDRAVNPYRGCEHGCVYCYARPSHAWLGLSPGLDFESRLVYKPDIAASLRRELAAPGYRPAPIALGSNTDAYQPVERKLGLTRQIIELLDDCRHPLTVVTKSALVERDIDLLAPMASAGLARVYLSVTTLEGELARRLEPRAAAPRRRLQTIERLASAGIPVGVMVAPLIPVLTDAELERILRAARDAGAGAARYILLRLPREVAPLFSDWLEQHVPGQAARVLGRIRDTRGGELYRAEFGQRMTGRGDYAAMLAQRFQRAVCRLGFEQFGPLDCSAFRPPAACAGQLRLL